MNVVQRVGAGGVFRIAPPLLTVTDAELDRRLEILAEAIAGTPSGEDHPSPASAEMT